MSERLRLFVALDLPRDVRCALAAWAAAVVPEGVRLVPQESLHLTLAFLGACSPDEAAAVAASLAGVAAPLGELRTDGALWLPPRRPGVLTVALADDPALQALQASVAAALAVAVGYEPEQRRFRPHVTVGRVARDTRIRAAELDDAPELTFGALGLTLYRSHLDPHGARYEPLVRTDV